MRRPTISAIVPIYNKIAFLRTSLDSVVAAAGRHGGVELVFVDHHSSDGSWELLQEYAQVASLLRYRGGTISAVRNFGVRHSRGGILAFIDSDCVVPPTHFTAMEEVFGMTHAVAAGREYDIPSDPHWSERTWYGLHALERDYECRYINGGNFAVRREAFDSAGGFDESLAVAEDTDLCARLRMRGGTLLETGRLNVVHLGNPKSVRDFFRKQVWHGLGILGGGRAMRRNKATLMVAAHAGAILLAPVVAILPWPPAAVRTAGFVVLLLAVPSITVAYRAMETGRLRDPARSLVLYSVFYAARVTALVQAAIERTRATHRRRVAVAERAGT